MKLFKLILSFTSFAFLLSILSSIYLSIKNPELKWDWEKINTENMFFPMEFSWGTATAAHQVEGNNTNNNWYQWEYSVDEYGKSRIHRKHN